jgi:hypothetical protein
MSTEQEKSRVLGEADVDVYETQLIDLLYEIEEEGRAEGFYIGIDGANDELEEAANAERINMLCETLGIAPNKLADAFIAGCFKNSQYGDTSLPIHIREARRAQRHGTGVGKFMVHLSWEVLPVEGYEYGSGSVCLSLKCEDGNTLQIESDGGFETIYPPLDSDEDSVMSFKIAYKASVLPANQTEL